LFPYVFKERLEALRGESAVSEQALQSSCEAGSVEEALRTERYLPLFQVSWMQAESAGAEGKRQNLYYLPEVQERIHQKKLIWQGKGELGMFGYININQKIMTEENRKAYQAYYCGLCRKLKTNCGVKGQALLTYDMTFLIVLLTGLYEVEDHRKKFTCAIHPTKKQLAYINEITDYAADMNVVLAYENFGDDWRDHHSIPKKAYMKVLDKDYQRIYLKYPRQVEAIQTYIEKLEEAEAAKEYNIDAVAGLTGEMLGEIFAWKDDEWKDELKCFGYYLGKFIYLMDAYEDLEKDTKNHNFNVLRHMYKTDPKNFDAFCKLMLTSMLSECAKSFERLPIIEHGEIIRNILYSGVWTKYEYMQLKKKKKQNAGTRRHRK